MRYSRPISIAAVFVSHIFFAQFHKNPFTHAHSNTQRQSMSCRNQGFPVLQMMCLVCLVDNPWSLSWWMTLTGFHWQSARRWVAWDQCMSITSRLSLLLIFQMKGVIAAYCNMVWYCLHTSPVRERIDCRDWANVVRQAKQVSVHVVSSKHVCTWKTCKGHLLKRGNLHEIVLLTY